MRGSRRAGLSDSKLVRLLGERAGAHEPPAQRPLSEKLSHWLGWTQAIELAAVLDAPQPTERSIGSPRKPSAEAAAGKLAGLRASLTASIEQDFAGKSDAEPAARRRRHAARQQAMEAAIAAARADLRRALSSTKPQLARLAALDEAMERMLGERERVLLSAVPRWAESMPSHTSGRDLLLAELDFRLQPLEALLQALQSETHDRS
jgi:hypothetical protein